MRPTRYPSRARALLCEGNSSSCFRSYSVMRAHVLLAAALRLARFCCGPSLEFSDSLHIAWLATVYQAIRAKADILFEPLPQLPPVSFLLPVSLFGDRVFVPCDWLALQGHRMHNLRERRAIRRPPRACLLRGRAVIFRRRTFFYKNVIDG